jgi:hypothetical protein
MAKRKSPRPQLPADLVRNVGIVVIVGIALFFLVGWVISYAGASGLFTIRDVVVADNLGKIDAPELENLKGHNIFAVRLDPLEARLRSRYPALSGLRVMRSFPDQIVVSAVKRESFARLAGINRNFTIDRGGYLTGVAGTDDSALPLIRGIKTGKASLGEAVEDERIRTAVGIITIFRTDALLTAVPLKSVDVGDLDRISCVIGDDANSIEVIVDDKNFRKRTGELGTLLSRGEIDLMAVKYIDLRFGQPIIGQKKKTKKI